MDWMCIWGSNTPISLKESRLLMDNLVIKTRGGNKYFYLNSIVRDGKIEHVVAGFNTGVIITSVNTGIEVDRESLIKMRLEYSD